MSSIDTLPTHAAAAFARCSASTVRNRLTPVVHRRGRGAQNEWAVSDLIELREKVAANRARNGMAKGGRK